MKILIALFLSTLCAFATDKITATITVTNLTVNGQTLTVNSSVRTFTNNVVSSSTQVLTNSDVTGCGSKTNLYKQIGLNLFPQLAPFDTGSNTFQLVGACGGALIVNASAGWASVTYSTQTCASATPVAVPFSAYYPNPAVRTTTASQLTSDLNTFSTNALNQNAPVASELVGTTNSQTITGPKTLSNTNNQIYGIISSLGISGNSVLLSNGLYLTPIFLSPVMTNGVNYGNAFSSPGDGNNSEQSGVGAVASGESSSAYGYLATATGNASTAIGEETVASGQNGTAIGQGAHASGMSSVAVGAASFATAQNSSAFGEFATASYSNSTAVGQGAITTSTNQVMLGAVGSSAVVPNTLSVGSTATIGGNTSITGNESVSGTRTNLTLTGQGNFLAGSDIAFGRFAITTLANGNNAAVPVGTNTFIEVSGPSADFAINGIANGRDGKLAVIVNQTGFNMTIAHQSGTDPTAANRIISMTGADRVTTGNGTATLIYSAAVSRWLLINFDL